MHRILLILLSCFFITSCSNDKDDVNISTSFSFTHNWDGEPITNSDFNTIQYTNENGQEMSIEKLRYLISKITFSKTTGEIIVMDGYSLIDVTNNTNMTFANSLDIPTGTYNISFTFGFDNNDNTQNYTDLNSASWSVPSMLGGGYHYMQLEGKFINNSIVEEGYAYHAIRAVDNSGAQLRFQDTFFTVNLGEVTLESNSTLEVKMNIAEWFKNPNTWNLNVLGNMLMPNFDAQIMMHDNGQNVFSLGEITN